MNAIRTLVALAGNAEPASVQAALPTAEGFEVVDWANTPADLAGRGALADLVIVAGAGDASAVVELVKASSALEPDRPVVVLQLENAPSNGFMQEVFTAGADDLIALPEAPEDIRHALQKAIARKRGATFAKGSTPAPLVCVLGPKGGTGKTVTACNLGVALAEAGRQAVLVDLDLSFGDVGLGLRLAPERTLYELARAGGSLDSEKLEDFLATHESGLRALLAPTRPDHAGLITSGFISETFAVLRSMSDVVVVDSPAGFTPEVITAVDSSTDVCMVATLDAFSLKDTKLGLETLDRMGYVRDSIRVVLNRADSHVGISQDDVKAILGRSADVLVPSNRDIPRSVTDGNPIVSSQPRSSAAKAFRKLAGFYSDTTVRAAAHTSNGGLRRETRRKKSLLRRS